MAITLNGTVGITGMPTIMENATTSATAATGTINYDTLTQTVLYYTTNASANWTVNIRGNNTTTLNSMLSTGQSLSIVFMVTQGSTAYYNNVLQIDGSTVTPKWQGGIAPTFGNTSGVDVYNYSIIKTAPNTYNVFASQSRYA
jgi:hypothetical protein